MFPQYRSMTNAFALKSLLKPPEMPETALSIGDDEYHASVPLVIFRDQHAPATRPVVVSQNSIPYEKMAAKGSGDTLSLDNFVTDDFSIGRAYDSP